MCQHTKFYMHTTNVFSQWFNKYFFAWKWLNCCMEVMCPLLAVYFVSFKICQYFPGLIFLSLSVFQAWLWSTHILSNRRWEVCCKRYLCSQRSQKQTEKKANVLEWNYSKYCWLYSIDTAIKRYFKYSQRIRQCTQERG